jgi:hypothetical protein
MIDAYVRKLFYHGAAVIWVGLIVGFPFGLVVMDRIPGDARAWHMAHLEGVLNGLLTFGAASALKHLSLDERYVSLYASCFIVAAWGNVLGSIVAAIVRQRGLELAPPMTNIMVFTMFAVAIAAVLVGLFLLMRGAQAR